MASAPEYCQIVTAADVSWASSGGNFQGYLLLLLALPTLDSSTYTKAYLKGQNIQAQRLPLRLKWPIVDGTLDSNIRVWQNSSIVPPSTRWCDFWYDETGNLIAQGSTLLNLTDDSYTITVPTLDLPSAAGSFPTPESQAVPATQLISSLAPTIETASGSGTSVTLSTNPVVVLGIYHNGQLLKEGISNDYTISGTAVTFNFITAASGSIQAVYWA